MRFMEKWSRDGLQQVMKKLRDDFKTYKAVMADPRCPGSAKLLLAAAAAYALSPVDLIPDFIPVLGQLDDLIIVPLLIRLALKRIPRELVDEHRCSTVD